MSAPPKIMQKWLNFRLKSQEEGQEKEPEVCNTVRAVNKQEEAGTITKDTLWRSPDRITNNFLGELKVAFHQKVLHQWKRD